MYILHVRIEMIFKVIRFRAENDTYSKKEPHWFLFLWLFWSEGPGLNWHTQGLKP